MRWMGHSGRARIKLAKKQAEIKREPKWFAWKPVEFSPYGKINFWGWLEYVYRWPGTDSGEDWYRYYPSMEALVADQKRMDVLEHERNMQQG